jgi:anti-sigma regulatory factor (Ser/Thr protein kinase)
VAVEDHPAAVTGVQPPAPVPSLRPPYLLTAATGSRGVGVTVTGDASTAVVELTAHGPWSPRLAEQVTARLRLCLAGPSTAIIIDLQHMDDPFGVSLAFWLDAWRQARLGPSAVHLTFCLPVTATLSRRLRNLHGPQPRVCATVPEARIAITGRISRSDRVQTRLPPEPASVGVARRLVTQACLAWQLPQLVPDTALIMSELAANAVEHACTDFIATVARGATGLHLAVRDGASAFPRTNEPALPRPPGSLLERGRGLRLIHTVAAAWGAMPARGGKVVWATVTSVNGRAVPRAGE